MLQAVIGAHYGDEGKGLITDYLSTKDTLVVRYNGGSQAGHTVTLPDGRSHEFQHFGSGTFKGATTLFTRHTIVSPSRFLREYDQLHKTHNIRPKTFVDPRALVTTPFDMLINRSAERHRGTARHGSCGYGINETVERSQFPAFRLTVRDLDNAPFGLVDRTLERIRRRWVPHRCKQLGIAVPPELLDVTLEDRFSEDASTFLDHIRIFDDTSLIAVTEDVVFEGAQGLRLCETRTDDFPYLTRSKPGVPNIIELLKDARRDVEELHVRYVTRAYVTRHGAGPFPGEKGTTHPYDWVGPETNKPNEFQGTLRYGFLTREFLEKSLVLDREDLFQSDQICRSSIALTCMDQVPEFLRHGVNAVASSALPVALESYGPTRDDVRAV